MEMWVEFYISIFSRRTGVIILLINWFSSSLIYLKAAWKIHRGKRRNVSLLTTTLFQQAQHILTITTDRLVCAITLKIDLTNGFCARKRISPNNRPASNNYGRFAGSNHGNSSIELQAPSQLEYKKYMNPKMTNFSKMLSLETIAIQVSTYP